MNDYLERLQRKELEILQETVKVCEKLNLTYVLFYGTLIGAIRHGGFIPWDDDIDIAMPRADYEIFLREAPKYFSENLLVQHYTTEKNTNNLHIKIRDKNTLFLESDNRDADICKGIFIDVFPLDRCEGDGVKEYKNRHVFLLARGCYSKWSVRSIQKTYKRLVAWGIHYTFCKVISLHKLIYWEDRRRKKANEKGQEYYLGDAAYCGTAKSDELFDVKLHEFENTIFCVPRDYDTILRQMYGNYMELPPVEKRITHKPLVVKFDLE